MEDEVREKSNIYFDDLQYISTLLETKNSPEIEVEENGVKVKMLISSTLVRFCGAVALKQLCTGAIRTNEAFKEYLEGPNAEMFVTSICDLVFTEPNIKIREQVAEAICDIVKQMDTEI